LANFNIIGYNHYYLWSFCLFTLSSDYEVIVGDKYKITLNGSTNLDKDRVILETKNNSIVAEFPKEFLDKVVKYMES